MTFQAFARARRLGQSRADLQSGVVVEDAAFISGYASARGFRDAFARLFGETPAAARGQTAITLAWFPSPLGPLVAGDSPKGICFLEFSEPARLRSQLALLQKIFAAPIVPGRSDRLEQLQAELQAYFAGKLRRFQVELEIRGTPFQVRVWRELLKIPFGETRSYEELAAAISRPAAVRAVGTANGRNRLAIVIPCHRVVNKSGALGGYGGGLRRKEFLLTLERDAV